MLMSCDRDLGHLASKRGKHRGTILRLKMLPKSSCLYPEYQTDQAGIMFPYGTSLFYICLGRTLEWP